MPIAEFKVAFTEVVLTFERSDAVCRGGSKQSVCPSIDRRFALKDYMAAVGLTQA